MRDRRAGSTQGAALHAEMAKRSGDLECMLQEMFFAFALENRYSLHPRKIRTLGKEEAGRFLAFLASGDEQVVREQGHKRMLDGLGHSALVGIGSCLSRFCRDCFLKRDTDLMFAGMEAVDRYMVAYLHGYVTGLESEILQSQEQMRRALTAALESQRRELAVKDHAINTSINGIMLTDLSGKITYVNPAFLRMWGYRSPEEVMGMDSVELWMGGSRRENIVRMAEKSDGGWRGELKARRRNGSSFEVEVSASFILDSAGDPVGIMASFVDITERKLLEAEFREAQKIEAIGTLAGGIAHDFNNLLTAIQGNVALMLLDLDPEHPHYERLKIIEQQVESGTRLTSQLLGYARKGRYEVKPVDLNRVVRDTSEAFHRTRKELTVVRNLTETLRTIKADRSQIEQVLLNLYINAADAMPGGGTLTIETRNVPADALDQKRENLSADHYVQISVSDTGIGMDPEILERIFDPFFSTKDRGAGTGLGLASVYGIVKGHDGFIEVESERGAGSTFRIYLPACADRPGKGGSKSEEILRGTETILLVEDEEMVMYVGSEILRALGYTVLEARNGREAVEVYRRNRDRIELVILDMIMPTMGGGETFDVLKAMDPEVKVLLCSGYSLDGQAAEILSRGCKGFIQKPLKIPQLSKKIREILDGTA